MLLSGIVVLQFPVLLAELWTKASWFPLEEWENNAILEKSPEVLWRPVYVTEYPADDSPLGMP